MLSVKIIILLSALPVLAALGAGAFSDLKTRTFPKEYWVIPSRISGFVTFLMYCLLVANQEYLTAIVLAVISVILGATFYVLGMRFGSGGDYRALMYISILTPALAIIAAFYSCIAGVLLVVAYRKNPLQAPWAVGILASYIIAIGYLLFRM